MVTPITTDERRQLAIAGTVVASCLVAFWLWAVATGNARWLELLLPVAMLAMFTRGLVSGRHPRVGRWLQWASVLLVAGGAIYAFMRVWGIAHRVPG